jgi:predicted ribonuclease YlaK
LQTLTGHIFRSNPKVLVEPLLKNRVKEAKIKALRKINLGPKEQKILSDGKVYLAFNKKLRLRENEIVMFVSAFDANGQKAESKTHFLGIKKDGHLKIIRPDVKVFEHGALNNGKTNWLQVAAIEMLKDPDINVVFLQGGAGSGKTFLALAGGLEAKKTGKCKKIVVMRLPVPLDSKHFTGTLPGDVESKHAPWLLPIIDNLTALCPKSGQAPTKSYGAINFSLLSKYDIVVQPLDYIKGSSFRDSYIIIEEAQDLTPRQIKQIITRVGTGTKIVFTGDLNQISEDDRHINRNNSGLPYAISRLTNEKLVGIVTFENIVRGPVAALAERKL